MVKNGEVLSFAATLWLKTMPGRAVCPYHQRLHSSLAVLLLFKDMEGQLKINCISASTSISLQKQVLYYLFIQKLISAEGSVAPGGWGETSQVGYELYLSRLKWFSKLSY